MVSTQHQTEDSLVNITIVFPDRHASRMICWKECQTDHWLFVRNLELNVNNIAKHQE